MIKTKNNKQKKISKSYALKINQEKRKFLLNEVDSAITHHEKFKNVYFFQPPSSASSRRSYEKYHSFTTTFMYDGKEHIYSCNVSCTCRYVEYRACFSVGDEIKDVRAFKKIRTELENAIANYKGGKND